jgi:Reverse transcriptase (RNA-dependent DNA polymerase)
MGAVDKGEMVRALLIDLSKAFDSISHQKLILELSLIGCGLGALEWFSSYLSNRLQRVSDLSQSTDWKLVSRGVPQGSCLSPLLFNIFVRNLPAACHANVVQFADDLTNSCSSTNIGDIGSDSRNPSASLLTWSSISTKRNLLCLKVLEEKFRKIFKSRLRIAPSNQPPLSNFLELLLIDTSHLEIISTRLPINAAVS